MDCGSWELGLVIGVAFIGGGSVLGVFGVCLGGLSVLGVLGVLCILIGGDILGGGLSGDGEGGLL